jgi:hypothetical protein
MVPLRRASPAPRHFSLAQSLEYVHTVRDLSRSANALMHRATFTLFVLHPAVADFGWWLDHPDDPLPDDPREAYWRERSRS